MNISKKSFNGSEGKMGGGVEDQFWIQIRTKVAHQARRKTIDQTIDQSLNQLRNQVWAQFLDQVLAQVLRTTDDIKIN